MFFFFVSLSCHLVGNVTMRALGGIMTVCGWNKEVIRTNEMSKKIFKGRRGKWHPLE